ncbi:arsenate-mycothiol transferase ArsC [Pararhodospirillum oryzae]|uniref:ArsC family transcriptional regulator n=1 Tax=Pararhodospirillum oryzae TaxID=478448 RepID=A0A512H9V3_9PROT|nr:arsenate reductase ArsC [Pararhodospirillum oryzae]GEO82225.1 ArsC family transcriptional regulator [Pararhodospirillum oryzae]
MAPTIEPALVLPSAVLFCCTMNRVRSPMAEGLMKRLHGKRVFVESVGVRPAEEIDGFVIAVMDEIGIDLRGHRPRAFEDLQDESFDEVVSLSPEAQHKAVEMTRWMACEVTFWHTFDPSLVEGSRETRLEAYRAVRDELQARLLARFPIALGPAG